jgi:hypothetical protein
MPGVACCPYCEGEIMVFDPPVLVPCVIVRDSTCELVPATKSLIAKCISCGVSFYAESQCEQAEQE